MRWFAVHQELATNSKWLSLSMDLRGAWITLLTIAAANTPRGTIRDRPTAEALLRRDLGDPAHVGELIDRGWIDEDEDGTLTFHDFDLWQLRIKKPSDWPEKIRRRVAEHRAKAKERTEQTGTQQERTGQVTPSNAGNALLPCPSCDSTVNTIDGKRGRFYGCSACEWKSNSPPMAPIEPWVPSAADLVHIEEQTPLLRRAS